MDFDLGPYFCDNPHHALLHHVLDREVDQGVAVEFGTGYGHSARCIARYMPVATFGSEQGLPEDWRAGFPAGSFAEIPFGLPKNVTYTEGLFEDTLPGLEYPDDLALVHFDADLYSSTAYALSHIGPSLRPGVVVLFDEFWGYPEAADHEQRAWREFVEKFGVDYEVLGHGVQQWSVRIK